VAGERVTLTPFGARFTIGYDDDRFVAAASEIALFPDLGVVDAVELSADTGADTRIDPAWPETSLTARSGGITLRCGSAVLDVDHVAGAAHLRLPPVLLDDGDAVRTFVEGALSSLLIGRGAIHAVHAGLVVVDGAAMLLRGASGAGKSTLTYAAYRAGATVVSDDWVYAAAGHAPGGFAGYPWRIYLVPDTVRFFAEIGAIAPAPHPSADRWKVPIVPVSEQRLAAASADAVVLLDPAPQAGWREVSGAEALARFWSSALPSERSDLPPTWVADLLDRPCFVVQRGRHPDDAAGALAQIAALIGS
jgi:hypothetical protein